MNSSPPYDLVIGLDRSDTKADLCLIDTHTGQRRNLVLDTAPEALWEWLSELRQQHPQARVGLCLEQYFPQALTLCGEDLWRPLATAFLLKWPSLLTVQKVRPATLKQFYYLQGSRSQRLLDQRLALVQKAVAATDEVRAFGTPKETCLRFQCRSYWPCHARDAALPIPARQLFNCEM